MNDIKKEEFFRNNKVPTRAKVLMHTMYSPDTDEIHNRLKVMDISKIEFAKSVYDGYEATKKKTNSSLNYYCWVLSFKTKINPPGFYKSWYLIYRHFCVRSLIDPYDLIGIDYKFLKYIAGSGQEIMSEDVTRNAIEKLKELSHNQSQKWGYLKDLKEMRRDDLKCENPDEFVRKWFTSGLI